MKNLKYVSLILECGLYGIVGTFLILYLMVIVKGIVQKPENMVISISYPAVAISVLAIGTMSGILLKDK